MHAMDALRRSGRRQPRKIEVQLFLRELNVNFSRTDVGELHKPLLLKAWLLFCEALTTPTARPLCRFDEQSLYALLVNHLTAGLCSTQSSLLSFKDPFFSKLSHTISLPLSHFSKILFSSFPVLQSCLPPFTAKKTPPTSSGGRRNVKCSLFTGYFDIFVK